MSMPNLAKQPLAPTLRNSLSEMMDSIIGGSMGNLYPETTANQGAIEKTEVFVITISSSKIVFYVMLGFDLNNNALCQFMNKHVANANLDTYYQFLQEYTNLVCGYVKGKLLHCFGCGLSTPHRLDAKCCRHLDFFGIEHVASNVISAEGNSILCVEMGILVDHDNVHLIDMGKIESDQSSESEIEFF